MSDSYYRWFPGDYLRDTGDLSLLEHGAYRILLDHYYSEWGIPDDIPRLQRICKAHTDEEKKAVEYVVERFFPFEGGGRKNKRAEREIIDRSKFLLSQAEKGRKSAESKKSKSASVEENPTGVENLSTQGVTGSQPDVNRGWKKVNLPSPSPSPIPTPKKEKRLFVEGEEPLRLCHILFDAMRCNNPTCREPNWQSWAVSIDAMLRLDKRTSLDIEAVIRWCQGDSFWKLNILSTKKLREKFDQLYLKMSVNVGRCHGPEPERFADRKYVGDDPETLHFGKKEGV